MPSLPASDGDFLLDVNALTQRSLEHLIAPHHAGVAIADFEVVSRAACGDGVASTADRINLRINYRNNPDTLPEHVILKTLLLNPRLRLGLPSILSLSAVVAACEKIPLLGAAASRLLFIVVGAFQKFFPQAPDAMYDIESRFYREIRPQLDIEAPRVFGARYDTRSRQFAVLMEDLCLRGARFPSALESLPLSTVKSTLSTLAKLHARYWNSAELESTLAWVPTRFEGGMFPVFRGIGYDLIRYQVEHHSFKKHLLAPLGKSVRELWDGMWRSQHQLRNGPCTLLHGDTHVGNSYVLPDGSSGLLDFQLLVKGNPIIDVTYYICTALDIDARRQHERSLIEHYLGELQKLGVAAPSIEDSWRGHRLASLWGLVIGWLITPPANYGEAITAANIERMTQAVIDLDVFAVLDSATGTETAA